MDRQSLIESPATPFSQRVQTSFGRQAPRYGELAVLQRAVAWRLAHHVAALSLPAGPCADLGAGTGLLGQALLAQQSGAAGPAAGDLLQVDLCPELLARNQLGGPDGQRLWDLEQGLPAELRNASLLCSSFALQWLADPPRHLRCWCRSLTPGGWLALAVPTAGCFPEWRLAAAHAAVPCTALPLPQAAALAGVAGQELALTHLRRLRFSRADGDGRQFLRALRNLGASPTPRPPLGTPHLRRLLQHWPAGGRITWEVLVLVGQRR